MIVKKYFVTLNRRAFASKRNWVGYFLFGFIPLYIRELK